MSGEQSEDAVEFQSINRDRHVSSPSIELDQVISQPLGAIAPTPEPVHSSTLIPSLDSSQRLSPESTGAASFQAMGGSDHMALPDGSHSSSFLPSVDYGERSQPLSVESVPSTVTGINARQIADLVNEALIEQAQRQGVDLF